MIETKVSVQGSVSVWVIRPDGRRVTVQVPRGLDSPENLAAVCDQVVAPNRKPR